MILLNLNLHRKFFYAVFNGFTQIMDESLFQQLKMGFSSSVDYSYEINEPNVICTEDTDDFEWPKNGEEAAKLWVVVIDYHF